MKEGVALNQKNISIAIIFLGMGYMIIDGWILSWFFVPDYVDSGPGFVSNETFYTGTVFFTFWALSVPLGSIITALGFALYIRLEKFRLLIFIIGSLLLLFYLGFWSQSVLYPAIYGIGGGLILFAFCVSMWSLAKLRNRAEDKLKIVFDLRAIGYIFLVITAWGMCGLLGVPSFGLRPDKMLEYGTNRAMLTMGVKVLVCFTFGWIFLAVSQIKEYQILKRSQLNI